MISPKNHSIALAFVTATALKVWLFSLVDSSTPSHTLVFHKTLVLWSCQVLRLACQSTMQLVSLFFLDSFLSLVPWHKSSQAQSLVVLCLSCSVLFLSKGCKSWRVLISPTTNTTSWLLRYQSLQGLVLTAATSSTAYQTLSKCSSQTVSWSQACLPLSSMPFWTITKKKNNTRTPESLDLGVLFEIKIFKFVNRKKRLSNYSV